MIIAVLGVAEIAAAAVSVERVGIEVAPLDPGGKPWDRGSDHAAPDPQIDIALDGVLVKRCKKAIDAFTAECEVPDHAPLTGDTEITLRVDDADHGFDEKIGRARGVIRPDADGRLTLEVKGKLVTAWAEVRQTADPSVSPLVAWALGAALGCALALLAGVVLGRRASPGPETTPRRRGPLHLAGRVAALAALVIAVFVYRRAVDPLLAAVPLALGAFCVTAVLVDIVMRKQHDGKHLNSLVLGTAAIVAVFVLRQILAAPALLQKALYAVIVAFVVVLVLS